MSLLPSSRPEVEAEQRGDFRLLGFDDEATDAVLEALSSGTARSLLSQLHEEPRAASELADRADLSIQNVTYHLRKLEAANLVEVVGKRYSEKGREMDIYGPVDEPLVVFVGTNERKLGLRQLLQRLVGATGLLAVLSLLIHSYVEGGLPYVSFTGAASGDGGGVPAAEPTLPLATAVFLGGFVVLLALLAWRYWEAEVEGLLARVRNAPLLGGRHPERSRQVATVAVGAAAAVAIPWLVVTSSGIVIPSFGPVDPAPAFGLALVVAAAVQAYYNDGLLLSWLVVFAPVAVFVLGIFGVGPGGSVPERTAGLIGYPVLLGAIAAIVLGTAGFVLGAGARRLVARLPRLPIDG